MGLRNPSRLSIDPKTDIPYTAWVGPDAGAPSATLGPSTYENAAQITHAGNYGWPYCMGNKQAYRDRIAAGTPRTDNARRATSPAARRRGGTDGWYDCDNLATTRRTTPAWSSSRITPARARTPARCAATTSGTRAATRAQQRLPGLPACRAAPTARRTTAPRRASCARTPQDDGMTIMDGPVYRYDEDAADNSKRWPEYWDGRWFLHNNGGPSIKHGLLLDPATAGTAASRSTPTACATR